MYSRPRLRSPLYWLIAGFLSIAAALWPAGEARAFSFSAPTGYHAVAGAHNVRVADFDGDSKPDLAVANAGSNKVSILFGRGGSSFSAPTNYPVGPAPTSIEIADLNSDGKLDLAVTNFSTSGTDSVSVLLGNGNGTFSGPTNFSTGFGFPFWGSAGDFDGDGSLDLAITNFTSADEEGSISILLGNGDGTFDDDSPSHFPIGSGPEGIDVGDFNRDGDLDVVAANYWGTTVSVLLGNGDGTLGPETRFIVGSLPISVKVADLNSDGLPDVAATAYGDGAEDEGHLAVLLGNGSGSFASAAHYPTDDQPISVETSDFNGDARLDLVVANQGAEYEFHTVSILLGKGDGTFSLLNNYDAGRSPYWAAPGDFNGDARPDLAVANNTSPESENDVSVLRNSGPDFRKATGSWFGCPGGFDSLSHQSPSSYFSPNQDQSYATGVSYKADTSPRGRNAYGIFNRDGQPAACENPTQSTRPALGFGEGHSIFYGGAFRFGLNDFWSRMVGNVTLLDLVNPAAPGWAGRFVVTRGGRIRFHTNNGTTTTQMLSDDMGRIGLAIPVDDCWHLLQAYQRLSSSSSKALNFVWIDGVLKVITTTPNYPPGSSVPYNTLRAGIVQRTGMGPGPILYVDEAGFNDPSRPPYSPPPC